MTERRCEACEALIHLDDECNECLLFTHNAAKSKPSTRTRCKHGHIWTEENTRWKLNKGKYSRQCRECEREQTNNYYKIRGHILKKEKYAESKKEQG